MPKAPHERRAAHQKSARRVSYCSECGDPTGNPNKKTCSDAHRAQRSRRIKKQNAMKRSLTPEQKDIAARIDGSIDDVTHKVVEQELRPVVREALSQEVFNSIQQMTQLIPPVVLSLQADLASEDDKTRQKAAELILRYTVGNTAVLKDDPDKHTPLQINFALPRPEEVTDEGTQTEIESVAEEMRECDTCHEDKGDSHFIENSLRCRDCFAKNQEKLKELLQK